MRRRWGKHDQGTSVREDRAEMYQRENLHRENFIKFPPVEVCHEGLLEGLYNRGIGSTIALRVRNWPIG